MTLFGVISLGACATRQAVPIQCVTHPVEIYVDGRLLEANPDLLELSTDEPHKVYVKAPGYEPQLYTFEPTVDAEGNPALDQDELCIELVPIAQGRELQVEIEDPESAPASR